MIIIPPTYKPILFLLAFSVDVEAKIFPDIGHTFDIGEESFLKMIEDRVEAARLNGTIASLQEEIKVRVRKRVMTPLPVSGLQKTDEERSWYYDPSITLDHDIRDHETRLIHAKGTTVNPLHKLQWRHPLYFIDGTDEEQITWALSQVKENGGKIVLTKGSPIGLYRETGQRFFFDQGGKISGKFQLKQIPARITQDGDKLLVEEIRGTS